MSKRIKFFLSHLIISIFVAVLVVGLVFFLWYPYPLAKAVGVTKIFLMLISIDVIVGPVLGFLVYKVGKKTLKMDLAIIILLQISALVYGIYTIEKGRPVWIAYNVDRFELVRANELLEDNVDKALPQYQQVSWLKPKYVAVKFADDRATRNKEMLDEVFTGVSVFQKPERYIDLVDVKSQIQKRKQKIADLEQFNNKEEVEVILKKNPTAIAFVPLSATVLDMVVLLNDKNEVVKIVDLRPWN